MYMAFRQDIFVIPGITRLVIEVGDRFTCFPVQVYNFRCFSTVNYEFTRAQDCVNGHKVFKPFVRIS